MTGAGTLLHASLQETGEWLAGLSPAASRRDAGETCSILLAILHVIRDRLGLKEAARLAAHLPLLIRGFYYDGWDPRSRPRELRSKEELLERIRAACPGAEESDAQAVARVALGFLAQKATRHERRELKRLLPVPLRELWP
jgi:uncharacterized protein (DUF2267 family)